ncbi:MAG: signal peptidase I [Candidatus Omnitrophota bacterium]|jgi:signal peptidase I|nr:MAG: signal peptidase I [Candidatus Omnitrophota bacterium]
MNPQWKSRLKTFWQEWVKPFLFILIIVTSFRSALADWNDVPSGSMRPTILEGDRIFVNKIAYDLKIPFTTFHLLEWGDPERGDIVVFFSPADQKRLVKRVVGIPGDVIEMKDNRLFLNGKPIAYESGGSDASDNDSISNEILGDRRHSVMTTPGKFSIRSFDPIEIPVDQYFMMGDNRDNSYDSRFFGFVDRRRIIGKAPAVVLSVDPENYYRPRFDRFFSALP